MIADKGRLLAILDDIERGLINAPDIAELRRAVTRLDEMDDLVDAICSCRTSEIPVVRQRVTYSPPWPVCMCTSTAQCGACWEHAQDDNAPGRP